jgi:hypothetical protein
MTDIYGMRRANGDWFALEDHELFRVPLFHSSHDAMMARLRNLEMLLFEPVALDARLLKEIKNAAGGSDVDLFMVNDPFASLERGSTLQPAQLAALISSPDERPIVPRKGNGFHGPDRNGLPQTEWWN